MIICPGEGSRSDDCPRFTVDSKKLEHGCGMIHAGFLSFFGLGLEDGHVPTFWLLL